MRRLYEIIHKLDKEKLFKKVKIEFGFKKELEELYREWFNNFCELADYPHFSKKLICIDEDKHIVFWNYARNLSKAYDKNHNIQLRNRYWLDLIGAQELMGMRVYEDNIKNMSDEVLVANILYFSSEAGWYPETKEEERIVIEYETMNIKRTLKVEKECNPNKMNKGIFWIVDTNNLENNSWWCKMIRCDPNGKSIDLDQENVAKSGDTYNHKKYWESLDKPLTNGKPYNYYPRGRVEIRNNKAIIYLNPNIADDEIVAWIKKEFGLDQMHLKKIEVKVDGSEHYKCYLDR